MEREKAKSLTFFSHFLLFLFTEPESSRRTPGSAGGLRPCPGRGLAGSSPGLRAEGSLPGGVWDGEGRQPELALASSIPPAKVSQRNQGCSSKEQRCSGLEFPFPGLSISGNQRFSVLPSLPFSSSQYSSPLTFKRLLPPPPPVSHALFSPALLP